MAVQSTGTVYMASPTRNLAMQQLEAQRRAFSEAAKARAASNAARLTQAAASMAPTIAKKALDVQDYIQRNRMSADPSGRFLQRTDKYGTVTEKVPISEVVKRVNVQALRAGLKDEGWQIAYKDPTHVAETLWVKYDAEGNPVQMSEGMPRELVGDPKWAAEARAVSVAKSAARLGKAAPVSAGYSTVNAAQYAAELAAQRAANEAAWDSSINFEGYPAGIQIGGTALALGVLALVLWSLRKR
jgi:hypothetical protein